MNLMSELTNGKRTTSPVLVLVCVTMPLTYASPTVDAETQGPGAGA
jgi:hypothetical protein